MKNKEIKRSKPLNRPCLINRLFELLTEVPRYTYNKNKKYNVKIEMKSYSVQWDHTNKVITIKPRYDYFKDGSFSPSLPTTRKFTCSEKAFEYLTK